MPVAVANQPYREAMEALQKPARWSRGLVLVLSLAAFLVFRQERSPGALAVLVGVLLFHELGHYAGMRVFGYGDVRMFFIPFFGAAVSGRPRGAAAWKDGVVLLLGPLPGIVLAFVLARRGLPDPSETASLLRELAIMLVTINAFNLLPLAGLDGARLLQQVLFSRNRWLEMGFQICAALAMGGVALALESVALGLLAYFMLIVLPFRWRLLGEARRLRAEGLVFPLDARDLNDQVGPRVFVAAASVVKQNRRPRTVAGAMEQLVDAVNARPPSVGASLALIGTWLAALVFAMVTLVFVYRPAAPPATPTSNALPRLELQSPGLRTPHRAPYLREAGFPSSATR
jgi:Zn-dependent protease